MFMVNITFNILVIVFQI